MTTPDPAVAAGVLEDERYETNSVESGEACQEELTRASYDLVCWTSGCRVWTGWERGADQEIPFTNRPRSSFSGPPNGTSDGREGDKLGAFDFSRSHSRSIRSWWW